MASDKLQKLLPGIEGSGTIDDPYFIPGLSAHAPEKKLSLIPYNSPEHGKLHGKFKTMVRHAVNFPAENRFLLKPLIKKKQEDGYINPEVRALAAIAKELMAEDSPSWTENPNDDNSNRRFWTNFWNSVCLGLDEDSYYLLRFLKLVDKIIERKEEFNLEKHKNSLYWLSGPEVYRAYLQRIEDMKEAGLIHDDTENNAA